MRHSLGTWYPPGGHVDTGDRHAIFYVVYKDECNVRGYAVLPVLDIRSLGLLCHAVSHPYRVTKLNSPNAGRTGSSRGRCPPSAQAPCSALLPPPSLFSLFSTWRPPSHRPRRSRPRGHSMQEGSPEPRTSCATARLYRGPSPPQCLEGDGPWAHDAKTPSRPYPSRPPPPICLWIALRPLS